MFDLTVIVIVLLVILVLNQYKELTVSRLTLISVVTLLFLLVFKCQFWKELSSSSSEDQSPSPSP